MDTLNYIAKQYNLDFSQPSPFAIRCCRVNKLPILFRDLGFTIGVELGVAEGNYSEKLHQTIPNLKLFSVDMFEKYPMYGHYRRQRHYDSFYQQAKEKLEKFSGNTIVKKWSMDAVKDFADESLDFIFIDANHDFEHVTEDIAQWSKKVRKGGIISGHDFYDSSKSTSCTVETVVRAWTKAKRIHPWFILKSPLHAELSWMWVKQ